MESKVIQEEQVLNGTANGSVDESTMISEGKHGKLKC